MSDLCWKCREKIGHINGVECSFAWTHCHHEPKEKEKCWCDGSTGKEIWYNEKDKWKISFCPVCGRKL